MGYIYKITNNINDKVYIGKTTFSIERRWKEHQKAAYSSLIDYPLYRAMRKYGLEHFIIEQIEEVDDKIIDEREQYWIQYYESYISTGKGYNATLGGEGNSITDKNLVYTLWDNGYTITEISNKVKANRSNVRKILQSYANYSVNESQQRGHRLLWQQRFEEVEQYDLQGNFIQFFPSLVAAEQETGLSKKGIWNALNYKTLSAYGYQWKYTNDTRKVENIEKQTRKQKRPVLQYINNEWKEYESSAEAQRQTNIQASAIRNVCQGKLKTAGGYIWKYKGE